MPRLWQALGASAACVGLGGCSLLVPLDDYEAGSATGASAASGAPSCTTRCTSSLKDDFSDGQPGPNWVAIAPMSSTVAETNGQLVITLVSGYAGYHSVQDYDMRGDHVLCEVPQTVAAGQARLRIQTDDQHFVELLQSGDMVLARSQNGDVNTLESHGSASLATARWWRLREAGGTLFWETSATGSASWGLVAQASTPIAIDAIHIRLSANTQGTGGAGQVHFDNFNLPPQ